MRTTLASAIVLSTAMTTAYAQDLVGPTDAWFGIDNLEITYSGGTERFNVRFDQRSFNDVFGAGTPVLAFTSEADVEAAFQAMDDFLSNPLINASQLATAVAVPGGTLLDDGFVYPITTTATTIPSPGNLDFGGPLGWRYSVRGVTYDRADDLVQAGDPNLAWAVFTPVPPCAADCNGNGVLNVDDVDCFVAGFLASDLGLADCNGDATLNVDDVDCFVATFLAGCP